MADAMIKTARIDDGYRHRPYWPFGCNDVQIYFSVATFNAPAGRVHQVVVSLKYDDEKHDVV